MLLSGLYIMYPEWKENQQNQQRLSLNWKEWVRVEDILLSGLQRLNEVLTFVSVSLKTPKNSHKQNVGQVHINAEVKGLIS